MTVESSLFDALKGFVANRCFPDVAPSGTASPWITYQQVGGEVVAFYESAMPSSRNGRFQVSCWSETRAASASLIRQIEEALVTSTVLRAVPLGGAASDYDTETRLYGARQFFSIWF